VAHSGACSKTGDMSLPRMEGKSRRATTMRQLLGDGPVRLGGLAAEWLGTG